MQKVKKKLYKYKNIKFKYIYFFNLLICYSEWHLPYPRLCAYHDCHSLAAAWGIGPPTTSLEATRPTGASQAQSFSEDDFGDRKSNRLLASCPAFR